MQIQTFPYPGSDHVSVSHYIMSALEVVVVWASDVWSVKSIIFPQSITVTYKTDSNGSKLWDPRNNCITPLSHYN